MMIWIGWTVVCITGARSLVLFGLFAWYSKTEDFNRRVGREVVKVLENATGGRVELGRVTFDLWHLAVEADGLVIHGLEGPGEAPYIAVDKVLLRVQIFDFFTHVAGSGISSHVRLNYLGVEQSAVSFDRGQGWEDKSACAETSEQ